MPLHFNTSVISPGAPIPTIWLNPSTEGACISNGTAQITNLYKLIVEDITTVESLLLTIKPC